MCSEAINQKALEDLRQLFGDEFNANFEKFLSNTQEYLNGLEAAVKDQRQNDIGNLAHKLVSATAQYGAMHLSQLAKKLEYSSAETLDKSENTVAEMKSEFSRYKNIIQKKS